MKTRTVADLNDKYIGHRKFAKVCDLLIKQNHKVENIKEYNEHFKFTLDGYEFQYSKNWKASAKDYVKYLLNVLDMKIRISKRDTTGIWRF